MRMVVHPLETRGPMAAFNGGIIVMPNMTVVDERPVPADIASAVIDAIGAHGLYPWIYRAFRVVRHRSRCAARGAGSGNRAV